MLLYDILLRGAHEYPAIVALLYHEETLSYGELFARVNRLASAFKAVGIGKGDSVAILLPNCPQFTITYYAVAALGAVCVPANPLLKPAELEYIWNDSSVKLAVSAPALLDNVLTAKQALPALRSVVSLDGKDPLPQGATSWTELAASGREDEIAQANLNPSDPAVCIYTSGTTGHPKGALLSHHNLLSNCEQVRHALDFRHNDNFLCVLPLFHSFAGTVCQNAPLYCGAHVTIMDAFHPARTLETIEQTGVTVFAGVPTMYAALLHFPTDKDYSLKSVRVCVSGGAPMPMATMEAFEKRFNTIIIEGDGPTECSPVTSVNPPEGIRKPGSIGLPIPGVEMRIFDDDDNELPDNEIGEIVVRGDNVMLGYRNQPEATAEAMKNGWYHTGDLGRRDGDGYFYIVDRKKDMIIVGGMNVYPREVEETLYRHPAIKEAAVIGAPDPLRGEEVVAVVVLKPDAEATSRDIVSFCRERMANFKVPRRVVFRDSLPWGGTGKILKRLLRKEMEMEG